MMTKEIVEQIEGLSLETDPSACLELLGAMYPELSIEENTCTINTELHLEHPLTYALTDIDGQEIDSFVSPYVEGYQFSFSMPLTKENFAFSSSFFGPSSFQKAVQRVKQIIEEAHGVDNDEFCSLDVCDYIINQLPNDFVDENLPEFRYNTTSAKEFESWKEVTNVVRSRQFNNERHECSICLYTRSGADCVLLDCDHKLCKACLKDLALASIDNGDVLNFRCPECPIEKKGIMDNMTKDELKEKVFRKTKSVLSDEQLTELLGKDLVVKYHKLLEKRKFQTFAQHYPLLCSECPKCERWDFKLNPYEKIVRCEYCLHAYCYECKKPWHGGNKACFSGLYRKVPEEDIEAFTNSQSSQKTRDILLAKHGRNGLRVALSGHVAQKEFEKFLNEDPSMTVCPKCKSPTEKADGCNVMTCIICETKFCFLCLKILSVGKNDPYNHYGARGSEKCRGKLHTY